MKKILFILLITALVTWGSFVVSYAHQPPQAKAVVYVPPASHNVMQTSHTTPVNPVINDAATPVPTRPSHNVVIQGSTNQPQIALTFDDGPNTFYTPQILAVLQKYHVHATFFCIGRQVQAYPYLVQQETLDGDIVGDHTWNHPDLTRLAPAAVEMQLSEASDAILQATGEKPTLFRPPYGAIDETVNNVALKLGMTSILWSVDPQDWARPGTNVIIQRVLNNTRNGSIILMHDGGGNRMQTLQALPTIITILRQRGFTFVTIPQLLQGIRQVPASASKGINAHMQASAIIAEHKKSVDFRRIIRKTSTRLWKR